MHSEMTTLITFLVCTPPNTRSVKLFGSWDSFTKPYMMEKDLRIGEGHWRGCHNFKNITCDGTLNSPFPGRDGALKMGSTYWYYYRLDDDVDYYNGAEPSTTACPYLPGQQVNILHVPVHLPSSKLCHSRDSSVASNASERQTMNPADKYLNPRTPPRPKLPRLRTSPAPFGYDGPFTSPLSTSPLAPPTERSASHPRTIATRRKFQIGTKLVLDLSGISGLPAKPNTFRSAFAHFASPHTNGADCEVHRGRPQHRTDRGYNDGRSALRNEPHHEHRVLSPPVPSPKRTSKRWSLQLSPVNKLKEQAASAQTKDSHIQPKSPMDLYGKRLPTLPNTPSSVLDEELRAMDAANRRYLEEESFKSHFSEFTAASPDTYYTSSFNAPTGSRFSAYSSDSDVQSPSSMTSDSTLNNAEAFSPVEGVSTEEYPGIVPLPAHHTDTANPPSTITSPRGIGIPRLYIRKNTPEGVGDAKNIKFGTSLSHLVKPRSETPIGVLPSESKAPLHTPINAGTTSCAVHEQQSSMHVHATMQELMDELSYLGEIIQARGAEAY